MVRKDEGARLIQKQNELKGIIRLPAQTSLSSSGMSVGVSGHQSRQLPPDERVFPICLIPLSMSAPDAVIGLTPVLTTSVWPFGR